MFTDRIVGPLIYVVVKNGSSILQVRHIKKQDSAVHTLFKYTGTETLKYIIICFQVVIVFISYPPIYKDYLMLKPVRY